MVHLRGGDSWRCLAIPGTLPGLGLYPGGSFGESSHTSPHLSNRLRVGRGAGGAGALVAGALVTTLGAGGAAPGCLAQGREGGMSHLKVETTGLLTTVLEVVARVSGALVAGGLVAGGLVAGALVAGGLVGCTGFVSTSEKVVFNMFHGTFHCSSPMGPMLMFPAKEGIVFLPPSLSETI